MPRILIPYLVLLLLTTLISALPRGGGGSGRFGGIGGGAALAPYLATTNGLEHSRKSLSPSVIIGIFFGAVVFVLLGFWACLFAIKLRNERMELEAEEKQRLEVLYDVDADLTVDRARTGRGENWM